MRTAARLGSLSFLSSFASAQSLRWTVSGTPADTAGWALARAGDVDGDGKPDIVIGEPESGCLGTFFGRTMVVRGIDGVELDAVCGTDQSGSGYWIGGDIDIDGDGHCDDVVGTPFDNRNGGYEGSFAVYSGATGALLREVLGSEFGEELGGDIETITDL